MSRKTSDAERKYSSYELEALAVIEALKKFRVYLLGKTFKIVTDCAAFQQTIRKKDLMPRIARWILLLEEYNYTIEHRSGTRLKHVDALSRHPVMTIRPYDIIPKMRKAQDDDEAIRDIKKLLERGLSYQDYVLRSGLIYRCSQGYEQIVVPRAMQNEVIKSEHERGHFAAKRTEEEVKREFFIPDLHAKVERCLAN